MRFLKYIHPYRYIFQDGKILSPHISNGLYGSQSFSQSFKIDHRIYHDIMSVHTEKGSLFICLVVKICQGANLLRVATSLYRIEYERLRRLNTNQHSLRHTHNPDHRIKESKLYIEAGWACQISVFIFQVIKHKKRQRTWQHLTITSSLIAHSLLQIGRSQVDILSPVFIYHRNACIHPD